MLEGLSDIRSGRMTREAVAEMSQLLAFFGRLRFSLPFSLLGPLQPVLRHGNPTGVFGLVRRRLSDPEASFSIAAIGLGPPVRHAASIR